MAMVHDRLMNIVVPRKLAARDVAFPFINSLSFG